MKGITVDYITIEKLVSEFREFLRMRGASNFESKKNPDPSANSTNRKTLVLKIKKVANGHGGSYVVGSLLSPWGEWLIAWTFNPEPWEVLVQTYRDPLGFTHLKDGSFPPWEDSPLSGWQCYRVTSPDVSQNLPQESAIPVQ